MSFLPAFAIAAGLLVSATGSDQERLPDDALFELGVRIHSTTIQQGGDTEITIEITTREDEEQQLDVGGFAQYFGVYILGPWGPIEPDQEKVLPQNWMHQQHSAPRRVVIRRDQPYTVTFRLSDYFSIDDPTVFRPGSYQMNIKFHVVGKTTSPIDSGPLTFTIE